MAVAGEAAARAESQDYIDMLGDVDARQKFFGALTSVSPNDHSEVKAVKNKIAKMLQ